MLPGCRMRLLQKAAAQLQRFSQYSSLTALTMMRNVSLLAKTQLLLEGGFHGKTDTSEPDNSMASILLSLQRFLVAKRRKHDPLIQVLKGSPDLISAPSSDTDFVCDTGQVT